MNSKSNIINEVDTCRAGDGNRTRTISLGSCTVWAAMAPELRGGLPRSVRERPSVTGVNGTLMARRPLPGVR
jgi:hypothetical protein